MEYDEEVDMIFPRRAKVAVEGEMASLYIYVCLHRQISYSVQ